VLKNRKFRAALAGAVAVVALLAVAGSGDEDEPKASGDGGSETGKGLGSSDASADVTSVRLLPPDAIGVSYVEVAITNHSSKASDYFVTVTADSADGATRYDETIVSVMGLNPNQTSTEKGIFSKDVPADAKLTVTEVQRTAST
jgi:hypothetical protein